MKDKDFAEINPAIISILQKSSGVEFNAATSRNRFLFTDMVVCQQPNHIDPK